MSAVQDFTFTDSDLSTYDGKRVLVVQDVLPGGFTVLDGNGEVVLPEQFEIVSGGVVSGVGVSLDEWLVDGELQGMWRIRYNRGMRGRDSLSASASDATIEEMMLYSLIFG